MGLGTDDDSPGLPVPVIENPGAAGVFCYYEGMIRRARYSTNPPRLTSIQIYEEDTRLHGEAKELAADMGISLSDLVWNAVEDYITLHQHIVTGEVRRATLSSDYKRLLHIEDGR